MTRFLKVEGESVWINLARVDGLMVRPQLQVVGFGEADQLEERHEATGTYEVVAFFQNQLAPVRNFASRAEAEGFVQTLLGEMET